MGNKAHNQILDFPVLQKKQIPECGYMYGKLNNAKILSPDTDVYNIGLPLPSIQEKEIIIQISTYSAR